MRALTLHYCHTLPDELTSGCSTLRLRLLQRQPPAAPQSRALACTGWLRRGRSAAAGPDQATAELPLSRPGMRLQAAMRCLHAYAVSPTGISGGHEAYTSH